VIVKPLNGAEVPTGVVTVTSRMVNSALEPIVIVIGKLVAVPPEPIVALTPLPVNATAVAPNRFVPAMVADSVVPAAPDGGVIDETEGAMRTGRTVAVNVGLFERSRKPVKPADTRK